MFGIKTRVSESFSRKQNRKRNRRESSTSFSTPLFALDNCVVLADFVIEVPRVTEAWGIESIALPRKEKLFVPSGALEATRYINLRSDCFLFFSLFSFTR